MVTHESETRLIGYGGMLMESLSADGDDCRGDARSGVYFAINTKIPLDQIAAGATSMAASRSR